MDNIEMSDKLTTENSTFDDNHHTQSSEKTPKDRHKKEETKQISKLPSEEQIKGGKELKEDQSPKEQPKVVEPAIDMSGGLPALPPKPPVPVRQAMPSASIGSGNIMRQRVPNVNQASKPQVNISPDLGLVGKIGAYQVAHHNPTSAADVHANILFWFYAITLLTTFIIMKKRI